MTTPMISATTPGRAPRQRLARGSKAARKGKRGIALLMVLTAIAIFTAIVVDFAYSSRVELDLAANSRDEVRAYFMARSAVNMSRLILHFQKQLDSNPLLSGAGGLGNLTSMLSGLTGKPPATGAAAATAPGAGGGGGMSIRLWELIPIDSGMIQMFLGGAGLTGPGDDFDKKGDLKPLADSKPAGPAFGDGAALGKDGAALPVGKGKVQAFGDFSGAFHAEVDDESKKFNIAWLDNLGRVMQIAITRGLLMFGDKRYEWLYDEEDAHHVRVTARDLMVNFHDFIDADATASVLNPTDTVAPFAAGFSDELQGYSRYKPQYKPKNAPMDSLDELYLVDGVSDRWMAAFRDRVTVFPDKNKAININTDDPFMQLINIYVAAANPNDPMLQNPLIIQQILHDIQVSKLFPGMGMTVPQFMGILTSNKVAVNPVYAAPNAPNSPFADKSDTFTIHATGEVGRVQKKLTVVVKTDSNLGQLLYWREE